MDMTHKKAHIRVLLDLSTISDKIEKYPKNKHKK